MHIYTMNTDGSGVRRLTNSQTSDTAPVWTPDGRSIVFGTMDSNMSRQTIEAMRPDGTLRHTIVSGRFLPWVRVAPDSRRIAFTMIDADGSYSISIENIDGSGQRAFPTRLRIAWDDIWSPDGKHFAFAERPPDPEKDPTAKSLIYIADSNGEHRRLLVDCNT